MMSLYAGLDNEKSFSPSVSHEMLRSQVKARKAVLIKAKNDLLRSKPPTTVAPVMDLTRPRNEENIAKKPTSFSGGEILEKYADEYDPTSPNEYDQMAKLTDSAKDRLDEKDREREIEERRKKRQQRHAQQGISKKPESTMKARDYEAEEMEYEKSKQVRAATKAAIAPPSFLTESSDSKPKNSVGSDFQFAKDLKGSVAHKIMSKYGFKEGKGLGKDNRGMSHALQVEKTSKRGGKIVSGETLKKQQMQMPPPPSLNILPPQNDPLRNPTKVVCLRNMVGPGEIDNELQGETSEECSKYGAVANCLIFEMRGVPDDEAVRIFLEFERLESAVKALIDLNGRFFGGRTVKANFYDIDHFKNYKLDNPIV